MGRSVRCINGALFAMLASCATTGAQTESAASLEASQESERAARAAGTAQRRGEQQRAAGEIRALLERESAAPLSPRVVRIDEAFQGAIASSAEPTIRAQRGSTTVEFAIGASEPVQCVIADEEEDQANKLYVVYQSVRERLGATQIALIDAGAMNGNRYIDLHFSYRAGAGASATVGYMKMRSLTTGDRSAICLHDELGYSQTFHRATLPLLGVRSSGAARRTYVLSVNDRRLGTMMISSARRDGQVIDEVLMSMIFARTPQDVMAVDSAEIDRSLTNREIIERTSVESENGAVATMRWLREGQSSRYAFEGTHLGRPLSGVVTARAPLLSTGAELIAMVRSGVEGRTPASEHDDFNASNPLVLTRVRTEFVRRVDAQHAWISTVTGRRTVRALVDAEGLPTQAEMTIGQLTLRVQEGSAQ